MDNLTAKDYLTSAYYELRTAIESLYSAQNELGELKDMNKREQTLFKEIEAEISKLDKRVVFIKKLKDK